MIVRVILWGYVALCALVLAAALLGPRPAAAHSFYDPWCCSDRDCAPIPASAVEVLPGIGYRVTLAPDQHMMLANHDAPEVWIVPFDQARVSADGDYHACIIPRYYEDNAVQYELRCLYVVPGGV